MVSLKCENIYLYTTIGGSRGIRTPMPISRPNGFQDHPLHQFEYASKFNFLWAQVKLRNFLVYNERCLRSAAPYNIFIHPSCCTLLRGVRTSFTFFRASSRTRTNNILITSEVQLPIVL